MSTQSLITDNAYVLFYQRRSAAISSATVCEKVRRMHEQYQQTEGKMETEEKEELGRSVEGNANYSNCSNYSNYSNYTNNTNTAIVEDKDITGKREENDRLYDQLTGMEKMQIENKLQPTVWSEEDSGESLEDLPRVRVVKEEKNTIVNHQLQENIMEGNDPDELYI